jgi:methionyl-tRNA synthetase
MGIADASQILLRDSGHVYLSKHEGWYSVSDEAFYPASAVQAEVDPIFGRKRMVLF